MKNALFSRLVGALVLAVLLLFSVNHAIGQIYVQRTAGSDLSPHYSNFTGDNALGGTAHFVGVHSLSEVYVLTGGGLGDFTGGGTAHGAVTGTIKEEKNWYDYVIPSGASVGGSYPWGVSASLDFDFSLPTKSRAELEADLKLQFGGDINLDINLSGMRFSDGLLVNQGTILNAVVSGFGTHSAGIARGILTNNSLIDTVKVENYGLLNNRTAQGAGTATINMAIVDGGELVNDAYIKTAIVNNGFLENSGWHLGMPSNSRIDAVTINTGGELLNSSSASIGTAFLNGGGLTSRDNAHISTANVTGGGTLENYYNARIGTANVTGGGTLENYYNAHIGTANVSNGGWLSHAAESTIGTATVDQGGTLSIWNAHIGTANVINGGAVSSGSQPGATGRIGTVNVYGGILSNGSDSGTGHIGTLNVSGGQSANGSGREGGTGYIGTANVSGGQLTSYMGHIDTANVSGGQLTNGSDYRAHIETANVTGGVLQNGIYGGTGHIETANVTGGVLRNGIYSGTGHIETANITGGTVYNNYTFGVRSFHGTTGHIGTAILNSGTLHNGYNNTDGGYGGTGYIGTAILNGGTLHNGYDTSGGIAIGRIDNLTYNAGFYYADYSSYDGTARGSIGNLTLAGDSTGIDWGTVDNVVFADNGNGILSITAFANGSFSGINTQNIDFTNGNVALDMTGLASFDSGESFFGLFDDGFALSSLFGGAEVGGELNFFQITLGDDFGWKEELFFFLTHDGELGNDWTFTSTEIVWGEFSGDGDNAVPEPATLAIIGLGLVGLGLARRRRKC